MRTLVIAALPIACVISHDSAAGEVALAWTAPKIVQYEPSRVHIEITNGTDFPLVLEMLSVAPGGAGYNWSKQVYGDLAYDEAADAFTHNRMAQMATAFKAADGIVAPGAKAHCAVPVTLEEAGPTRLKVRLSFHVVNSEEMARRVYLCRSETPLEARYTPAKLDELRSWSPGGALEIASRHFVTRGLTRLRDIDAQLEVSVKPAGFPLDEALKRVAIVERIYDGEGQRWLLETPAGMWVVTRAGASFLAGIGAEETALIEEHDDGVPFWYLPEDLPDKVRERVRALVDEYEPEEGIGVRFDVPTDEVRALALKLSALGLRLRVSDFQLTPVLSIRPVEDAD